MEDMAKHTQQIREDVASSAEEERDICRPGVAWRGRIALIRREPRPRRLPRHAPSWDRSYEALQPFVVSRRRSHALICAQGTYQASDCNHNPP